jgi:putative tryptophan/tyrosine transport system substrate-binding protein
MSALNLRPHRAGSRVANLITLRHRPLESLGPSPWLCRKRRRSGRCGSGKRDSNETPRPIRARWRRGGNLAARRHRAAEIAGNRRSGGCLSRFGAILIRELLPSAHRVAALANAPDPFSKPFVEEIRRTGTASGLAIDAVMIHGPEELDAAFTEMEKERPDAVIVQPSLPPGRVGELALKHRMPAVSPIRGIVDEGGGLLSYGVDETDAYRQADILVDKILKGIKPADLPVEQPTKFELVINLKAAKALGFTVPASLLARADEVIE